MEISEKAREWYQIYLRDEERYLSYLDKRKEATLSIYFELRRELVFECIRE